MRNARRVIVLFDLENGIKTLLKILNKFKNDTVYVLIHEDDSKVIYRGLKKNHRGRLRILVLGGRDIEIRSLKILVDTEPDVVIDCDNSGKLDVFKKLLGSTVLKRMYCYDLIT